MGWVQISYCIAVFLLLLSFLIIPSGSYNTSGEDEDDDGVLDSSKQQQQQQQQKLASMWGRRHLLQAKKDCPVDMENQNYTEITGQCKGPRYSTKQCCDAFLSFACPLSDNLNDLTTDCPATMFTYINLQGNYPPGLFANLCKGDKVGLPCPPGNNNDTPPAPQPGPADNQGGAATALPPPALPLTLAPPFLLLSLPFLSF